jgi:hypothetical protein
MASTGTAQNRRDPIRRAIKFMGAPSFFALPLLAVQGTSFAFLTPGASTTGEQGVELGDGTTTAYGRIGVWACCSALHVATDGTYGWESLVP